MARKGPMEDEHKDVWAEGEGYEPYVGRWSRLAAADFLVWLAPPPGLRWLDLGCGTGALTHAILTHCAPAAVVGVDSSPGFLSYAQARAQDERAEFHQAEAGALPVKENTFDIAVAGLVLNFLPDPQQALQEMARVVRPGGTVAAYVWDYAYGMEMIRFFWDAVVDLDPTAGELDEAARFPLANPIPLSMAFAEAGLEEVETGVMDIPTLFKDFEDYWTPFLGGQGPCPAYCMSLPESEREVLREVLEQRLPVRPDGGIALNARAWAVQGQVPGGEVLADELPADDPPPAQEKDPEAAPPPAEE